jgi:hypothetical protein
MDDFWKNWLPALLGGVKTLDTEARSRVFCECAKACAGTDILPTYRALLAKAVNRDAFFASVGAATSSVQTEQMVAGYVYDFLYPYCGCTLYTECGVDDAVLCECSRESTRWLMGELFPDCEAEVCVISSILRGDPQCRLRVTFQRPDSSL